MVTSLVFSPDGKTLASTAIEMRMSEGGEKERWSTKLWDVSTGKEIRILARGYHAISPDGSTLATVDEGTVKLMPINFGPLDLAAYLDDDSPWLELDGSEIEWTTTTGNLFGDFEFELINPLPDSHIEILRSAQSEEEKNTALFWNYLHAENWNSVKLLYARLTDRKSKESAREMMIIKRTEKAKSAFDQGLYSHARWHLEEITPLLKPKETDRAVLKAREKIDQLKKEIEDI